jgi:hypothetical protein
MRNPNLPIRRQQAPAPPSIIRYRTRLVRSLQAAVDAVHDSLQQDAGGPRPILPQVASDAADIAARPVDGAPTQPSHAAPLPPVPASAGATPPAIVAMTAQHENQDAGIHHILPAAAPVSHGLPQQPVNDVLSQANAPGAAPLPVVQAAAAAVQDVTAALESTLSGVVGVASGDSGAVTIPSLGGLGLDAMAGLLPPASAAPGPSHASDSVLASVEEVASFAAVGLPEVLHADQLLGHEVHSPLHLVGSGLL